MWYWIVMGILIFVAVLLIVIIIVALKKEKKTQDGYDYDEEYEDDLEDDDYEYEEEYRQPRRGKETVDHREVPGQTTPFPAAGERGKELTSKGPVKKQWKLILENLDTWEKFDFIFYDNIGIGRSRNSSEFERFLSVQDDPRVSKLHCAVIRKEDKLYLKDMGSRNGTYLNGRRIQQPVVIQRDDVIGVGETKIEVKKVLRERD